MPMHSLNLADVRRDAVPIRVAFLHRPVARGGGGPLAGFVRQRRALALDLLLLARAVWPLADEGLIAAPASDWARAIGLDDRPGNRASISRAWTWLEAQALVRTRPQGRTRAIEILCEDESRRMWFHPAEERAPYFQLPHAYWHGGFNKDLSLPAKAMLLIALSLDRPDKPHFELPIERGSAWYGLTQQSVRTGLRELREVGLLRTWIERRETDASPVGFVDDRRHALNSIDQVAWRRINL